MSQTTKPIFGYDSTSPIPHQFFDPRDATSICVDTYSICFKCIALMFL